MGKSRDNDAAKELWEQIFSRLATSEYAAIVDPDHDVDTDIESMRVGLAEAGWSAEEIESRVEAARSTWSGSAETSPGVGPHIEKALNLLCNDVEGAMERMGLGSQAHLARGVEPVTGPSASMTNVIMTDQGIVTVSSFFFRFCGLIARAFTRTLHLNIFLWESKDFSQDSALALLRSKPSLIAYWLSVFVSFAVTGTHIIVPYRPANRYELNLFEQVARAMELFAIAHEYGHHQHAHGRNLEEDPKREEFEADQFALKICYEIESKPFLFPNPYLSSGAGGVVLLTAFEILRSVTKSVTGHQEPQSDTHPFAAERIARFDDFAMNDSSESSSLNGFRTASGNLMSVVRAVVENQLDVLTPEMFSNLRAMRGHAGLDPGQS